MVKDLEDKNSKLGVMMDHNIFDKAESFKNKVSSALSQRPTSQPSDLHSSSLKMLEKIAQI